MNIVDLMKLQPSTEHPRGLTDRDFDQLFTRDLVVTAAGTQAAALHSQDRGVPVRPAQ